jgi:hypothetical protein
MISAGSPPNSSLIVAKPGATRLLSLFSTRR